MEPGVVLGRYEIAGELGTGGMATVHLARDTELRRDVAVKVLFPHLSKKREVVARFQREARAAASLDHPHILRVYDVGGGPLARPADDGPMDPPYIVLELVRGGSLREFITDREAPLAEAVAAMGVVLCSALSEAHAAGIIHRDIKPANIMVADGGRLVVSDFGVARLEDDSSLVTRTGALLGTPAFMSPEQAHGIELDQRSDVYSLGATLYKVATGSNPFTGPTPRVVSAITRGDLRPPLQLNAKIGRELARVIQRMMATEPDERYADAKHAGLALQEILHRVELGDADAVLTEYFGDPGEFNKTHTPAIVADSLARARTAAGGRGLPKAIALVDRVLALEPNNAEAMALVEQLGSGQRRWRVVAAAFAVLVVSVAAVVGYMAMTGNDDKTRPVAVIGDAGMVDAMVTDSVDDAGPVQVADARTVRDASPDARRRVVINTRPPVVRRSVPDAAVVVTTPDAAPVVRAPIDAAPPPKPAQVKFQMDAWCNLSINGTSYGRANPSRVISLKPGRYVMVCTQGSGLATWRKSVTLAPGASRTLTGSLLRLVRVTVSVKGGDRILIHGRKTYRNGATLRLRPGRYRVELLAKRQTVKTVWLTIPPVGACTIRDSPQLDCYR